MPSAGDEVLLVSSGLALGVTTPSAGDDSVLHSSGLARGPSNPSAGDTCILVSSSLAQASGAATGEVTMEGTAVNYFETNESHSDFWAYDKTATPHAVGLDNFGMADQSGTNTMYVFVHHDTANDSWAIGLWHWSNNSGDFQARVDFSGDTDRIGTTVVEDDPGADSVDNYGDSPPYGAWGYGSKSGDGGMWDFTTGSEFTITLTLSESSHGSGDLPAEWRGRGSDDNVSKTAGSNSTFDVTISV